MSDAFEYCERFLREHDKDRYLATLFASPERRPLLHALYAFDVEITSIALRVREPLAGEIRLQWWRDVITGEREEEASASPVAAALRGAMTAVAIERGLLESAIDAASHDVAREPIATLDEFAHYAAASAGSILRIAASILGAGESDALEALVGHAGLAAAALGALRQFALRASHGQTQVPDDFLDRDGAGEGTWRAGRATPALRAGLLEFAAVGRRHADAAMAQLAEAAPQSAWPAFLHVGLAPLYLDRMRSSSYDPFRTPLDVPQWRRQWRMWRLSRAPAVR